MTPQCTQTSSPSPAFVSSLCKYSGYVASQPKILLALIIDPPWAEIEDLNERAKYK